MVHVMSGTEFNQLHADTPFVKLTNRACIHNGYRYKSGVNTLDVTFTNEKCDSGGLYFCRYCDFPKWLRYRYEKMYWIWTITIPNDAVVVDYGDKLKCNMFCLSDKVRLWYGFSLDLAVYDDIMTTRNPHKKRLVDLEFIGFNHTIKSLPDSLTRVIFRKGDYLVEECFNECINNLPNSIKELDLGCNYSKIIEKLPSNLQTLTIKGITYPIMTHSKALDISYNSI